MADRPPNKLKKKVSFAALPNVHDASTSPTEPNVIIGNNTASPITATAPSSPSSATRPAKASWTSFFRASQSSNQQPKTLSPASPILFEGHQPDSLPLPQPPGPSDLSAEDTGWRHHERYFPVYSSEEIFGPSPHTPATASTSAYTFTSPFEGALTPIEAEAQALAHSAAAGRSVVVHYPDLPGWNNYLGGKTSDSIGWQGTGAKWGTDGWTGYGWGGEGLPDKEGRTFGAPMPEGKAPEPEGGKKKKGKGGGGGGGGGEGGEGEEGEGEEGEEAKEAKEGEGDAGKEGEAGGGGGAAGEGGGGGGGGGGGKKKKKKK